MSAEHEPTPKSRQHVELLTASGIQQKHIAAIVGISEPTLRKHYADELELGLSKMLAQVGATIFQQAIGRSARFDEHGNQVQSEIKPDKASAFFIMKCRGGWKETNVVEVVDPSAGARERLAAAVDRALAAFDGGGGAAPEPAAEPDPEQVH